MTKRTPTNIPASVHQLLLNRAHQTFRPFNEVLQYYAMERFLYRLSKSPHAEKFVLKGALMFAAWRLRDYRPTMDIDLLGKTKNQVDSIVAIMKEVCAQHAEPDGIVFDLATIQGTRIAEQANYQGVRIRLRGNLGGPGWLCRLMWDLGTLSFQHHNLSTTPPSWIFPHPSFVATAKKASSLRNSNQWSGLASSPAE